MSDHILRGQSRRIRRVIPEDAARKVRIVVFDIDGVMTDAGVYIGGTPAGETFELKRFDIQDGLAMKLLRFAGIEIAFVSGRVSPATTMRAAELGVVECHQDDSAHKLPIVQGIIDRLGIDWSGVAIVGDDLPDIPVMRRAGLPIAVRNAVPEVSAVTVWSTRKRGGQGAVREFVRALLLARGQWEEAVKWYLRERGDADA
jgi:3-deoxy-D-manno-octulosonate 8-phosphate phosphatase (KDO 8-P phosphatase)